MQEHARPREANAFHVGHAGCSFHRGVSTRHVAPNLHSVPGGPGLPSFRRSGIVPGRKQQPRGGLPLLPAQPHLHAGLRPVRRLCVCAHAVRGGVHAGRARPAVPATRVRLQKLHGASCRRRVHPASSMQLVEVAGRLLHMPDSIGMSLENPIFRPMAFIQQLSRLPPLTNTTVLPQSRHSAGPARNAER